PLPTQAPLPAQTLPGPAPAKAILPGPARRAPAKLAAPKRGPAKPPMRAPPNPPMRTPPPPPPTPRASAEGVKGDAAISSAQTVGAIFSIALLPYSLVLARVVHWDT